MKNIPLKIVIALVVIFLLWGWSGYNSLVKKDESVKNTWGNVQSQYQRRLDLIPNLVNTVRGEANFEKTTLTDVIDARAKATSIQVDAKNLTPEKIQEFQQAQAQLSTSLGRLLVVSENYPNLQTNKGFLNLQTQLEGTENRIVTARNDFNVSVKNYNIKVRSFPTSVFASITGFRTREGFTGDAGSQNTPRVDFNTNK
ncbi:MAG: LemA family protein [Ferruginibacter sp.]